MSEIGRKMEGERYLLNAFSFEKIFFENNKPKTMKKKIIKSNL